VATSTALTVRQTTEVAPLSVRALNVVNNGIAVGGDKIAEVRCQVPFLSPL
jgi:hypothetical protein